jgi:hypothetical protein
MPASSKDLPFVPVFLSAPYSCRLAEGLTAVAFLIHLPDSIDFATP